MTIYQLAYSFALLLNVILELYNYFKYSKIETYLKLSKRNVFD
jgi:hypothetical protein